MSYGEKIKYCLNPECNKPLTYDFSKRKDRKYCNAKCRERFRTLNKKRKREEVNG